VLDAIFMYLTLISVYDFITILSIKDISLVGSYNMSAATYHITGCNIPRRHELHERWNENPESCSYINNLIPLLWHFCS